MRSEACYRVKIRAELRYEIAGGSSRGFLGAYTARARIAVPCGVFAVERLQINAGDVIEVRHDIPAFSELMVLSRIGEGCSLP